MVRRVMPALVVVLCLALGSAAHAAGAANAQRPADVARDVVSQGGAPGFILLQDVAPFKDTRNEQALESLGYSYAVVPSAKFGAYDLTAARVILVASDQPDSFYQRLAAEAARLDDFVSGGGALLAHLGCHGWEKGDWNDDPFLPGAPAIRWSGPSTNSVTPTAPTHPILARISDAELDDWIDSSLGWLKGLPSGTTKIVGYEAAPNTQPCYVEYAHGRGAVLATTMVMEWHGGLHADARFRMQQDELSYALSIAEPHKGLLWVGTAGFERDGVSPDAAAPGSRFTFQVTYLDPSGAKPTTAVLRIQKRECNAWRSLRDDDIPMAKISGQIATGAVYRCSLLIPNIPVRYRFLFTDGVGDVAAGAPSTYQEGPSIVAPPQLCPPPKGKVVSPPTGPKGTTFTYRVVYKDAAGNEPTARALEIRRNGTPWARKTMQPGTTGINSFRYGKLYLQTVVIDQPGRYKYRFTFVDGSGKATGTATTWTAGPTITAPGSALVTAAAAAPFGRGAQVTFTLSDAAGVTATVLNVAGRPVKTIAADRPLEAGLQTLTWDGTAEGGLAVPAGLYLIHVTARGEDGSQSSAVAAARLR